MWVLECSGDDLKGKKIWMRPGKKFIFGRTKHDNIGDVIVLSHKTISRKHLAIEIGLPSLDDCCNPQTRSKIYIQDFDTKIGTLLNGKQIRGQTVELTKAKNYILLGRYNKSYFVNWIPVTLTFSFSTREYVENPYAKFYKIFGPLDIKILQNYEHNYTTHVVAKKRNTAKGLLALIDGKHIVYNDTFIDALIKATSQKDDKSLLEIDFEGNFPDPIQFLPPKGDEPTQREEAAYIPNELRKNIFNGYIFVFYNQKQYQNLHLPITAGSGEAILRVVNPDQTTVTEFVNFVKDLTRENRLRILGGECKEKRIIVVKYNPANGSEQTWFVGFNQEVSLQLNYSLIEQNEFLDAILANDASFLWRPLQNEGIELIDPPVKSSTNQASSSSSSSNQVNHSPIAGKEPKQAPNPGRVRRTARPKFTGFDDDFSGTPLEISNSLVEPNLIDSNHISPEACISQSQGLFVSQDVNYVSEISTRDLIGHKRKATPNYEEVDDTRSINRLEIISPELKRRRLHTEIEPRQMESILPEPVVAPVVMTILEKSKILASKIPRQAPRKKPADIDAEVEEMLHRKLELDKATSDLLAKAEREAICVELDSLEISEIRNKIEVKELPVKTPKRVERKRVEDCDRWNACWNGRKNFKRFRRYGAGKRISDRVIVQLEEVRKRDYGIFHDFLGETNKPKEYHGNNNSIESRQHFGQSTTRAISTPSLLATTGNQSKILKNNSRNQSVLSSYTTTNSFKRSAAHMSSPDNGVIDNQISMAKKPRLLAIKKSGDESDDESDDELKFRFKKK
ncbi:putative dna damage response protein [Erysiphe necator]|uniref:Putative dna damage response protein n=1 Tax=Uncinula necator TaxID=52586 RepID=A0A0B1PBF1_UNCNE|nr:putative dna damage response protein [Erysiphe necator]